MILVIKRRLAKIPSEAAGRCAALVKSGRTADGLGVKLRLTEQEIANLTNRTQALADELGKEYAAFRYECKLNEPGRHMRETGMMELSRKADDCIVKIYSLEKRRRSLLDRLHA